jgi:aminoglycoside phosphotransferase (APT) family kinase protein
MSSVSRIARVYGVPMVDDRRRPLRDDELARIARAIDPRARTVHSAALLGGLDAGTYAVDLDVDGERHELIVRVYTFPEQRNGSAARRYWRAISGIPREAALPVPRPVLLDAEGALVGAPCMVMTRLPGSVLARPSDEHSWVDQLGATLASIHDVDVSLLPADYPRAADPIELVETGLGYGPPTILEDLWSEVAGALRSHAPRVISNGKVLAHHDFWFGNTLWSGERLCGIVDLDGAQIDDPAFDVGYVRADMQLTLGRGAADRLLARYVECRGRLHALAFWELLSTLPAFRWLDEWAFGYREIGLSEMTNAVARERFTSFVRDALRSL